MTLTPVNHYHSITVLMLLISLVACEVYGYMSTTIISNVVLSSSASSNSDSGVVPFGSAANDKAAAAAESKRTSCRFLAS